MAGISEEVWLIGWLAWWRTQAWGSACPLHGQGEHQQSLIQPAVVELRGLPEALAHQTVGDFQFLQHR